jgi:hypothetical protein
MAADGGRYLLCFRTLSTRISDRTFIDWNHRILLITRGVCLKASNISTHSGLSIVVCVCILF